MKPFCPLLSCLFLVAASLPLAALADPIGELRSASVFRDADAGRLSSGEVLAARGPAMSFNRGLTVESAYVVRMPVARAVEAHSQFDPSRHSELKVFLQGDVSARPGPGDFSKLASAPANGSVNAFARATENAAAEPAKVQLSAAEAKGFTPSGGSGRGVSPAVAQFWAKVLAARAGAYASGGIGAVPAFEGVGGSVRPADDAARLLSDAPQVQKAFGPVIERSGLRGRGSALGSYQLFDVDGQGAVSLSAFNNVAVGDGAEAAEVTYYSSGGFYALLSFYRFWPMAADGGQSTLVWRVDLISSPAFSELRGIERVGSGAAFMREIQKNVKAFLRDYGSGR